MIEKKIEKYLNENLQKDKIAVIVKNRKDIETAYNIGIKNGIESFPTNLELFFNAVENYVEVYPTAISFIDGIEYARIGFYKDEGYTVIDMKDFIRKYHKSKSKYVKQLNFESYLNEVREPGQGPEIDSNKIKNFSVLCKTEEQVVNLQKFLFRNGIYWNGSKSIDNFHYGDGTILAIRMDRKDIHRGQLKYHEMDLSKKTWGEVYSYEDFLDMMNYDDRIKVKPKDVI